MNDTTAHECSCCECDLDEPLHKNANYVKGEEFATTEERRRYVALVHTEETLERLDRLVRDFPDRARDALEAEAADPDAPKTRSAYRGRRHRVANPEVHSGNLPADIVESPGPVWWDEAEAEWGGDEKPATVEDSYFEEVPFSIPEELFEERYVPSPSSIHEEGVVRVRATTEEVEVEKTGTVCVDCTEDLDDGRNTIIWGPAKD